MWDERIDQAAREMTSAEPPSDLRARVRAAIDAGPPRRWRPFVLVPIAASLVVLIAVAVVVVSRSGLARRLQPGVSPTNVARRLQPSAADSNVARSLQPSAADSNVARRLQPSAADSNVARRLQPSGTRRSQPSRPPREIDALAPPPVDVAPVPVTSLEAPDPLAVPTLTVTSIDVAPLSSEERRPEGEIK